MQNKHMVAAIVAHAEIKIASNTDTIERFKGELASDQHYALRRSASAFEAAATVKGWETVKKWAEDGIEISDMIEMVKSTLIRCAKETDNSTCPTDNLMRRIEGRIAGETLTHLEGTASIYGPSEAAMAHPFA